ncbi:hypothetical protein [Sorangium atrum]|uniref:Uncharacterized protein n=1 Tax=Sorangium atrum TaxID=2995308 RepID=A0ABT5BSM2_9BACT|nr:hypothetical protein [Sorangium aterium]MDC0677156.1 hypothetical protein [Sorangium aterium]
MPTLKEIEKAISSRTNKDESLNMKALRIVDNLVAGTAMALQCEVEGVCRLKQISLRADTGDEYVSDFVTKNQGKYAFVIEVTVLSTTIAVPLQLTPNFNTLGWHIPRLTPSGILREFTSKDSPESLADICEQITRKIMQSALENVSTK